MSKLVYMPMIGRFGNLLFQYAGLRAWAEANECEVCLPPWIGEKVFTIPEAVRPDRHRPDIVWSERYLQDPESMTYTLKQVREWFKIKPEVIERLQPARCRDPILLDIRQGADYLAAGNVVLGRQCYLDACRAFGYDPNTAGWEIDTEPTRLPEFTGDVTASGFCTTWVSLPAFYRLMTAPVLFRANSSFSWWAATLNEGKIYAPVVRGIEPGPNRYCDNFVSGNWPAFGDITPNNHNFHIADE